jgi:hypothetical protein
LPSKRRRSFSPFRRKFSVVSRISLERSWIRCILFCWWCSKSFWTLFGNELFFVLCLTLEFYFCWRLIIPHFRRALSLNFVRSVCTIIARLHNLRIIPWRFKSVLWFVSFLWRNFIRLVEEIISCLRFKRDSFLWTTMLA